MGDGGRKQEEWREGELWLICKINEKKINLKKELGTALPRSVQKWVCNPVAFGYIKRLGMFVKCTSQPQEAAGSHTCQSPVVKGEKTGAISQVSRELVNPRDKTALNWFGSHYSGDCPSTPCWSRRPWESFPTRKKEKERLVSGVPKL